MISQGNGGGCRPGEPCWRCALESTRCITLMGVLVALLAACMLSVPPAASTMLLGVASLMAMLRLPMPLVDRFIPACMGLQLVGAAVFAAGWALASRDAISAGVLLWAVCALISHMYNVVCVASGPDAHYRPACLVMGVAAACGAAGALVNVRTEARLGIALGLAVTCATNNVARSLRGTCTYVASRARFLAAPADLGRGYSVENADADPTAEPERRVYEATVPHTHAYAGSIALFALVLSAASSLQWMVSQMVGRGNQLVSPTTAAAAGAAGFLDAAALSLFVRPSTRHLSVAVKGAHALLILAAIVLTAVGEPMGVPISLAASTGLALLEADHVRLRHTRAYRLAAAHVTRALLVQAYVTVAMCATSIKSVS
ncbi:UL43 protein [Suid alphaherpesvirus 1]|uniref:UL43 n=2 Tax=Suid herpesvirus 1 TaxID=10345 RepID=I1WXF2_SUHV|nr:UL43 protein [Suid alphaherpesvirus 1]AEM64019.1 UL43 protein [Suid alphaherpesvirus 1]AFI70808.1 UL43 [Suid alphaherpesvirus 1]AFI70877.1 UL43 [Suid alphaherpesvirus 1]AFI70946.1 UL43 [Suid alphaherpesvirus 1]AID18744.1 UL43 [Suid alphaherpesvirus 1]